MNMAQATEFWSHSLGHFVSVLHCRVCACGSYGGGDVHEGGAGRTTQEVFSLPHQQNEVLEGRIQGTGSDYSSKATSTMQHTIAYIAQLMRPGIGRNASCAVGDFA